jgi:membrane protein implicated in regulation of membrane protease activity
MTLSQFAASLLLGIVSVLLPLLLFISTVAALVYLARRWIDRRDA